MVALILGVVCLVIKSDMSFLLFGMIPIALKTVGVIFLVIGIIAGFVVLAKKKK